MPLSETTILNIPVHNVTMTQTVALCGRWIANGEQLHQLCTVNPEFVMMAQRDAAFLDVLQSAELNPPDGIGLLYAARILGQPLTERIAGSEWVYHMAEACAENGWRLFLLGAAPGVAEQAAARLIELYPGLQIAGTYAGSPSAEENDAIVARVNASAADVLYVAYGAPRQDQWIARNRQVLTTVKLAAGVGGSLDFIAGIMQRAPRWVQRLGLEWLYRLVKEPWRWRRMLALPRFVLAVFKQRLIQVR